MVAYTQIVTLAALISAAAAAPVNSRAAAAAPKASGGGSSALGNAANAAGLASAGVVVGNFLSDLFGGGEAAKRDLEGILARAAAAAPKASGGSSALGNAANAAGLASAGVVITNFLSDLFGGGEAAKRDLEGILARAAAAAPKASGGSSALGTAANAAGLASAGVVITNFLSDLFGGGEAAKRDLANIIDARAAAAAPKASGGSSALGTAANAAGLASAGVVITNFLSDLFGGGEAAKRDLADIIDSHLEARAGFSAGLGNAAAAAGIASAGINIGNFLAGLFGGDEAAKRDLSALINTHLEARQNKALGNAASVAGLASAGINIGNFLSDLFGRDLVEEHLFMRSIEQLD